MIPNPNPIDVAAADWAVRQAEGALTAQEQQALEAWLQADSRHRGALLRAHAAWADLDRLSALAGPAPQAIPADTTPPVPERSQDPADRGSWFTRRQVLAASAAGLCTLGGAVWLLDRHNRTYVSQVGEIRHVGLSDGSVMVLNTATAATVRFDRQHREIELSRGEGLFEVAKDPQRPFIVRAGLISVRAVGTVFTVRTSHQRVDVGVSEGVVEILDDSSGEASIQRVAANERASILETSRVQLRKVSQRDMSRELAWREGMVDFEGEPLADAVEQVNRHNRRQIVVDNAALAARPVIGVFRANDPENFAATVAAAFGAQSIEQQDAIHLRAKSTP